MISEFISISKLFSTLQCSTCNPIDNKDKYFIELNAIQNLEELSLNISSLSIESIDNNITKEKIKKKSQNEYNLLEKHEDKIKAIQQDLEYIKKNQIEKILKLEEELQYLKLEKELQFLKLEKDLQSQIEKDFKLKKILKYFKFSKNRKKNQNRKNNKKK